MTRRCGFAVGERRTLTGGELHELHLHAATCDEAPSEAVR